MYSTEAWYLENGSANGFIKPYKNSRYAFAALLPKERGDIKEFASSLTGEAFVSLMRTAEDITVSAALPRFGYDYGANLNDILKALGMPSTVTTRIFPHSAVPPPEIFSSAMCSTKPLSRWMPAAPGRGPPPRWKWWMKPLF